MTDDKKRPLDDPAEDQHAKGNLTEEDIISKIRIFGHEYDPTLDPRKPEFNREKWDEATAETRKKVKETIDESISNGETIGEFFDNAVMGGILEATASARDLMQAAGQAITKVIGKVGLYSQSDEWREFIKNLAEIARTAPAWLETIGEIEELTPYLEEELKKPEYEGKTIDELMDTAETDDDGNPAETSLFMQAWRAAQEARDAAEGKEEPTHATIKRASKVEMPTDKPNAKLWNLTEKQASGKVTFEMATEKDRKKGVSLPISYNIDFDGLGKDIAITKRLLPFDKRVYVAVSALFNAGNNVITLSQIYYAMGNTGRPAKTSLQKINDAVTKMTAARITIDNEKEAKKYNYNHFQYDSSLLPLERKTAIVNGQLVDAAIHIFREPPLITFAKERKQITTVDVKLLQSPVSKTDANLLIDDYLIERISKAKNGKGHSCRILYKTLYDHANITTKKQEQRAPNKINKYLTHYQNQSFIKRYTTQKDGITVYW